MTTESDLTTAASASDPRVGLRAVRALRRLLEELERTQVRRARAQGLVVGGDRGRARGQPAGRAQEARQGLRGDRRCSRDSPGRRGSWSSARRRSRRSRGRARCARSTSSPPCSGTTTASPYACWSTRAATSERLHAELDKRRARYVDGLDDEDAAALASIGIDLEEVARRLDDDDLAAPAAEALPSARPVLPPLEEGARAGAARGDLAQAQLHRDRAHPARAGPRGRRHRPRHPGRRRCRHDLAQVGRRRGGTPSQLPSAASQRPA